MSIRFTTLLILLVLAGAVAAVAGPIGGLSAADVAKLRTTGCPIVAPRYVPPGFHLERVKVELDKRFGNSYEIRYKGPGKSSFLIQMANGGIGDGPDGDPYPFDSPVFGKGTLSWIKAEGKAPASTWSGWMAHPGRKFPVYSLVGTEMDPKVAVKITESLRFLSGKK